MANQKFQWINALSTCASLESAVKEVSDRIKESLDDIPDLGVVFISSAYASDYPRLMPLLLEQLPMPIVIGCGGGGIIGGNKDNQVVEIEGDIALSLNAACLPDVEISAFEIFPEQLPDSDSPPESWMHLIGVSPDKKPHFILLSEPFNARINELLEGLDFAYPESAVVGGLSSSGSMMTEHSLFYHAEKNQGGFLRKEGTVGIALSGKIAIDTIVAQGCRPIGNPYQVTQGERNIISSLASIDNSQDSSARSASCPPLEALRELIQTLDESDRELIENSLFIGVARDEFKSELRQGDFLIRNLLGVDPNSGAIAIGDRVRPGQRIQFHLRDAKASALDLELLLKAYQSDRGDVNAIGSLLFSCLGRGESLYNQSNFDSNLFCRYFQNIPLGGFFGNGEIGPVGGRTFLHGYTSAFAIIRSLS